MLQFNKTLYTIGLSGVLLVLASCSNTPNNVNMSLNQGKCVQPTQYSSSALDSLQTNYANYFALIQSNPSPSSITPYCIEVTVQNNNTGVNANSTQITSEGLQVSTYLPGSSTLTTAILYDSSSSGVTISGDTQNINNIVLFDPYNCATTTGANVQTLSSGGGSCSFYLEILNEGNPVGVYPYYISYNYTNGNQNYTANATIHQRVSLYGGDTRSPGLYYVSTNLTSTNTANGTVASWANDLPNSPESGTVQYVIPSASGTVYFLSGSAVYSYNGISINQIGNNLPSNVNSLTFDNSSNLYAATLNGGMWVYNVTATTPSWVALTDSNGNITTSTNLIGLTSYTPSNIIYAFSDTNLYICNVNGSESESCNIATTSTTDGSLLPSGFFNNSADVDIFGNLYTGNYYSTDPIPITLGISSLNSTNTSWSTFTIDPIIDTTSYQNSYISSIRYESTLYFGVVGQNGSKSSVFNCNTTNLSSPCLPTLSSSDLPITGNAAAVTTDGGSNLYIGGSGLYSTDFGQDYNSTTGAFLLVGTYAASSTGIWQPILSNTSGYPTSVSSIAVASMLTSN